ncbi:MAG: tetratricopeptide repeat protein [Gammaproteobacteria bacterium]
MNFRRLSWWLTPLISYYWVRARDMSLRDKPKKVLTCLKRIRAMRGKDIRPLGQWTAEYYITRGHAQYELGRLDEARESFREAFFELKKTDIYTRMEQSYLAWYVLSAHPDLNLEYPNKMDLAEINLDKIEPDLRNYYRLKAHPEWD